MSGEFPARREIAGDEEMTSPVRVTGSLLTETPSPSVSLSAPCAAGPSRFSLERGLSGAAHEVVDLFGTRSPEAEIAFDRKAVLAMSAPAPIVSSSALSSSVSAPAHHSVSLNGRSTHTHSAHSAQSVPHIAHAQAQSVNPLSMRRGSLLSPLSHSTHTAHTPHTALTTHVSGDEHTERDGEGEKRDGNIDHSQTPHTAVSRSSYTPSLSLTDSVSRRARRESGAHVPYYRCGSAENSPMPANDRRRSFFPDPSPVNSKTQDKTPKTVKTPIPRPSPVTAKSSVVSKGEMVHVSLNTPPHTQHRVQTASSQPAALTPTQPHTVTLTEEDFLPESDDLHDKNEERAVPPVSSAENNPPKEVPPSVTSNTAVPLISNTRIRYISPVSTPSTPSQSPAPSTPPPRPSPVKSNPPTPSPIKENKHTPPMSSPVESKTTVDKAEKETISPLGKGLVDLLHCALQSEEVSLPTVQALVQANRDALLTPDQSGRLPLHLSLYRRCASEITLYILRQCPLAARVMCNGWLPLHYALLYGASEEVLRELVTVYPQALETSAFVPLPGHSPSCERLPLLALSIALLYKVSDSTISHFLSVFPAAASGTPLCILDEEVHLPPNVELPLFYAIQNSASYRTVSSLVRLYEKAIFRKSSRGNSPLIEAVLSGAPLPVVRLLHESDPSAITRRTEIGESALSLSLSLSLSECERERDSGRERERDEVVSYLLTHTPHSLFTQLDPQTVAAHTQRVPSLAHTHKNDAPHNTTAAHNDATQHTPVVADSGSRRGCVSALCVSRIVLHDVDCTLHGNAYKDCNHARIWGDACRWWRAVLDPSTGFPTHCVELCVRAVCSRYPNIARDLAFSMCSVIGPFCTEKRVSLYKLASPTVRLVFEEFLCFSGRFTFPCDNVRAKGEEGVYLLDIDALASESDADIEKRLCSGPSRSCVINDSPSAVVLYAEDGYANRLLLRLYRERCAALRKEVLCGRDVWALLRELRLWSESDERQSRSERGERGSRKRETGDVCACVSALCEEDELTVDALSFLSLAARLSVLSHNAQSGKHSGAHAHHDNKAHLFVSLKVVLKLFRCEGAYVRESRAREALESNEYAAFSPMVPSLPAPPLSLLFTHIRRLQDVVRDVFAIKGCLVMLRGRRTLRDALRSTRPPNAAILRETMRCVVRCVGALHDKGIVHGNMCLENILYTDDERVALLGMGAAMRENYDFACESSRLCGRACDLPPEHFTRVDPLSLHLLERYFVDELRAEEVLRLHPSVPSVPVDSLTELFARAGEKLRATYVDPESDDFFESEYRWAVVRAFKSEPSHLHTHSHTHTHSHALSHTHAHTEKERVTNTATETERETERAFRPETLPYSLVRASAAIDAWSLGLVMYNVITGQPLFDTTHARDAPAVLSDGDRLQLFVAHRLQRIVDNDARELCANLLSVNPSERIARTDALLDSPYFRRNTAKSGPASVSERGESDSAAVRVCALTRLLFEKTARCDVENKRDAVVVIHDNANKKTDHRVSPPLSVSPPPLSYSIDYWTLLKEVLKRAKGFSRSANADRVSKSQEQARVLFFSQSFPMYIVKAVLCDLCHGLWPGMAHEEVLEEVLLRLCERECVRETGSVRMSARESVRESLCGRAVWSAAMQCRGPSASPEAVHDEDFTDEEVDSLCDLVTPEEVQALLDAKFKAMSTRVNRVLKDDTHEGGGSGGCVDVMCDLLCA